jgi:hypothetical protein
MHIPLITKTSGIKQHPTYFAKPYGHVPADTFILHIFFHIDSSQPDALPGHDRRGLSQQAHHSNAGLPFGWRTGAWHATAAMQCMQVHLVVHMPGGEEPQLQLHPNLSPAEQITQTAVWQ